MTEKTPKERIFSQPRQVQNTSKVSESLSHHSRLYTHHSRLDTYHSRLYTHHSFPARHPPFPATKKTDSRFTSRGHKPLLPSTRFLSLSVSLLPPPLPSSLTSLRHSLFLHSLCVCDVVSVFFFFFFVCGERSIYIYIYISFVYDYRVPKKSKTIENVGI